MNNTIKKHYDIDEVLNFDNTTKSYFRKLHFKYRLFSKFYQDYYERTPESDSLYRRRNRLIILFSSIFLYYKTSSGVFDRIELQVYAKKNIISKLTIPLVKSFYFLSLIFASQLFIKYIYYLNKVFKSYQFGLEGLLKYNIMEKNYIYRGDGPSTGYFDILDSVNIKKNQ